jgi:hypothetical protein
VTPTTVSTAKTQYWDVNSKDAYFWLDTVVVSLLVVRRGSEGSPVGGKWNLLFAEGSLSGSEVGPNPERHFCAIRSSASFGHRKPHGLCSIQHLGGRYG